MSKYTVETFPLQQHEEDLSFDPTGSSTEARDFVRKVVWENGATFRPIDPVAEPHYEGWLRYEINIKPLEQEEA
jgi:hypothetical protein